MALASHLLVYIDTVKKRSGELVVAESPSGYIQRMGNEALSATLEITRDVFELKDNQWIRFRRIAFNEFEKILAQEQSAQGLDRRDFPSIFQNSGAEPGSWVNMEELDGPVEEQKHEELELF
jgi:hypothetical protein